MADVKRFHRRLSVAWPFATALNAIAIWMTVDGVLSFDPAGFWISAIFWGGLAAVFVIGLVDNIARKEFENIDQKVQEQRRQIMERQNKLEEEVKRLRRALAKLRPIMPQEIVDDVWSQNTERS